MPAPTLTSQIEKTGIRREEFVRRRQQLMAMVGDTSAVVMFAAPERLRNGDVYWPYRQNSDFHYLCGFPEPQAVLVLLPGRKQGESILFCRQRESTLAVHDLAIGLEQARADYVLDDAFPIEDINDILPGLLEGREQLYGDFGREAAHDRQLIHWMEGLKSLRGGKGPHQVADIGYFLHEMRLFKSQAEIKLIRRAITATIQAYENVLQRVHIGQNEFKIQADFLHQIAVKGLQLAFLPIVATGHHSCVAHHTAGWNTLHRGDLLLLDAGAEASGYGADLARTFPVGGKFNAQQRVLYDIVLRAQQAAFDNIAPGHTFDDVHWAAVRVLCQGLHAAGLLSGHEDDLIQSGAYKQFFPYRTGHWLGLDVHDVGDYRVQGESRLLEPGMVFTVEPGLYIQPDDTCVPACWRGLGLRIEDDVLVTRHGYELLSSGLPRQIRDIEAMARSLSLNVC